MKLEQSFDVGAPLEHVWNALIDVERVAPCLPGAQVTGRNEDGTYSGSFSVKIGPTSASYTGKLQMESIDEAAHKATMRANGTDKRGQGGAKATIVSTLSPIDGGGTRVGVVTDYSITGRLARFGRGGMIEDISARLLREFAERLQASLVQESGGDGGGATTQAGANGGETIASGAIPSPPHSKTPRPGSAEPLGGLSLVSSVLLGRARRNLAGIAAALGGLLLATVVVRRARRR
jgi:carbon monoxide dehydrogenase subunit G